LQLVSTVQAGFRSAHVVLMLFRSCFIMVDERSTGARELTPGLSKLWLRTSDLHFPAFTSVGKRSHWASAWHSDMVWVILPPTTGFSIGTRIYHEMVDRRNREYLIDIYI
jgi:hypothetical protein